MDVDALNEFLEAAFPGVRSLPVVASVGSGRVTVRQRYNPKTLRPGGAISGPTMMSLADTVAYVALLAEDQEAVGAVTSHLSVHFLRRAQPGDLVGVGQLRKRGRRLSVVQVTVFADGNAGDDGLGLAVADATVTYAMP